MDKPINILDKDYLQWVKELCKRYMPDAEGLSERNLRYTKKFYQLYSQEIRILQQFAANSGSEILQQPAAKF